MKIKEVMEMLSSSELSNTFGLKNSELCVFDKIIDFIDEFKNKKINLIKEKPITEMTMLQEVDGRIEFQYFSNPKLISIVQKQFDEIENEINIHGIFLNEIDSEKYIIYRIEEK